MGHSDIGITLNTYADVFEAYQDKEVDKLNEYLEKTGLLISEDTADGNDEKEYKTG